MNTFEDNDHALLAGVVLGTLRTNGIAADVMLNEVEDPTPYLRVQLAGGIEVVIVVMPAK